MTSETSVSSTTPVETKPCRQRKFIVIGDIVWAKNSLVDSNPWWPATVRRIKNSKILVVFYAFFNKESTVEAEIPRGQVANFTPDGSTIPAESEKEHPYRGKDLKEAISLATKDYLFLLENSAKFYVENDEMDGIHSDLCFICQRQKGEVLLCDFCNNVQHRHCLYKPSRSVQSGAAATPNSMNSSEDSWICSYCSQFTHAPCEAATPKSPATQPILPVFYARTRHSESKRKWSEEGEDDIQLPILTTEQSYTIELSLPEKIKDYIRSNSTFTSSKRPRINHYPLSSFTETKVEGEITEQPEKQSTEAYSKISVATVLKAWRRQYLLLGESINDDEIRAFCEGLEMTFRKFLPSLTYKWEQEAYSQVISQHKDVLGLYGVDHLLRLVLILPSVVRSQKNLRYANYITAFLNKLLVFLEGHYQEYVEPAER